MVVAIHEDICADDETFAHGMFDREASITDSRRHMFDGDTCGAHLVRHWFFAPARIAANGGRGLQIKRTNGARRHLPPFPVPLHGAAAKALLPVALADARAGVELRIDSDQLTGAGGTTLDEQ